MRMKLWLLSSVPLVLGLGVVVASAPEVEPQAATQMTPAEALQAGLVEAGSLEPDGEEVTALAPAAPDLSPEEMEDLLTRKLQLREQFAAEAQEFAPSRPGLPLRRGRETQVVGEGGDEEEVLSPGGPLFPGNPTLLVIGRNNRNTQANSGLGSTLAEPAAANNARLVFAAGNLRHAEYSTNGGVSWTNVALPGGPTNAPIQLGDHDMVIDDAGRVIFHSALYINSTLTDGVFRVFVRRTIPTVPGAPAPAACSFTIDPPGTGVTDFPHIGLTKRFVYVTINAIGFGGGFARIYRFNADQMANCVATSFTTFTQPFSTFGQRVWTPAGGTNNIETMYWGQHNTSTTFRIFSWAESAAAPSAVNRTLTASSFTNPDCRGGTNNTDWIQRATAFNIAGFTRRGTAAPGALGGPGALAFYWNVGPDAAHTQGHIHAAVFSLATLALVAQPHVFNNGFCFGHPVVTANKRGDIGISLGFGGRAGGGGGAATAVKGAVGIDDEFTPGVGFFGTVAVTASGTHNPPPGPPNDPSPRYGDYFTIHAYEPCEKWFSATNYAHLNGATVGTVNSRYVEFGRQQSFRCYNAHRNQFPVQ